MLAILYLFPLVALAHPLLKRVVDPNLVPQFGVEAGLNPTGTGDCEGSVQGVAIPCRCPPPRDQFIRDLQANLNNGGVPVNNSQAATISFPTGNDPQSVLTRLTAATITLQNFLGPDLDKLEAEASTTFRSQAKSAQEALAAGSQTLPIQSNVSDDSGIENGNTAFTGIDPVLVPEFGIHAGVQPDGSGNCIGRNGALIPCTCPPSREHFIKSLAENLANGGLPVNNPNVAPFQFPLGNKRSDILARLYAAIVTLQNLNGPGVGCPQTSTTFADQAQAAQALPN